MTATVLIPSALLMVGLLAIGGVVASGHGAARAFSSEWVAPGGEITVTITAQDYGPFGQLQETLPEGFVLLGTSLSDVAVGVTGNTIKLTLLGYEEFTYTAQAPATGGEYTFSGILLDSNKNEDPIGGNGNLRVGAAPTPIPAPKLSRQLPFLRPPQSLHQPLSRQRPPSLR